MTSLSIDFNHYGAIHVYDQPDILTLISFIACAAACLGAVLNFAIGVLQLKNRSLVITP